MTPRSLASVLSTAFWDRGKSVIVQGQIFLFILKNALIFIEGINADIRLDISKDLNICIE